MALALINILAFARLISLSIARRLISPASRTSADGMVDDLRQRGEADRLEIIARTIPSIMDH
jgi:hypothetical protein